MESKDFKLIICEWDDETPSGKPVFSKGYFREVESGNSFFVKFDSPVYASVEDKDGGECVVNSNLHYVSRGQYNEYGQLTDKFVE